MGVTTNNTYASFTGRDLSKLERARHYTSRRTLSQHVTCEPLRSSCATAGTFPAEAAWCNAVLGIVCVSNAERDYPFGGQIGDKGSQEGKVCGRTNQLEAPGGDIYDADGGAMAVLARAHQKLFE